MSPANQRQPERSFDPSALEEPSVLEPPPSRYGARWWDLGSAGWFWAADPETAWTGLCRVDYAASGSSPSAHHGRGARAHAGTSAASRSRH
jgi:hypothetical protein